VNGRLALVCERVNGRSALTTIRFEGLARASRALPEHDGAVRVLTSTLGPGMLAGDRVTSEFEVGSQTTLTVASQMATPIFAGAKVSRGEVPSRIVARSRVAAGGAFYALGEPLLLAPQARHETSTELDVSGDGFALLAEIVVLGADARLRTRTSARIDGMLALRDASDLEGDGTECALLTVFVVTTDAAWRAEVASAFAALLGDEPAIRGGLGATDGATMLRARAPGAWPLQRLRERIFAAVRASRAPNDAQTYRARTSQAKFAGRSVRRPERLGSTR
jgi:urease accessory protein UreH